MSAHYLTYEALSCYQLIEKIPHLFTDATPKLILVPSDIGDQCRTLTLNVGESQQDYLEGVGMGGLLMIIFSLNMQHSLLRLVCLTF